MKEHLRIYGLGFVIVVAGFVLAYQFVKPGPPTSITIATGNQLGAYYQYAQHYKELLAEQRIDLTIISTAGSVDNIQRLLNGDVDLAFVQSGTGQPYKNRQTVKYQNLVSLASVYHEPLWLFMSAGQHVTHVKSLKGKRVFVGTEGSGTRVLSTLLLDNNGITEENTTLVDTSSDQAVSALLAGELDYLFVVASVESPLVQQLLREPTVAPFDFHRAKAYTRRYRFLSAAELPQGVIDFHHDVPATDIDLLAAAATLVSHEDVHPALVALLMQVFEKVHGDGGILEESKQFPSSYYIDFPLDHNAQRFFDYGPPLLQRYLPFWAAVQINQLKVLLIPLIALMIPLIRILPPLYRWRVRSRIYRWYRLLREIEQEASAEVLLKEEKEKLLHRLQALHENLMDESIPLSYHDELYHLRMHVELVRDALLANTFNV